MRIFPYGKGDGTKSSEENSHVLSVDQRTHRFPYYALNPNIQVMILSACTINDERSIQCLRNFKKRLYPRTCKPRFNSPNRGFWNSNAICQFLLRHIQLLSSCFDLCSYRSFQSKFLNMLLASNGCIFLKKITHCCFSLPVH